MLLVACSGSDGNAAAGTGQPEDEPGGTDVPGENTESNADADPRPVLPSTALPDDVPTLPADFAGCLSATWMREFGGSYSLWTYDAGSRVLASAPADESGNVIDSPDPSQSHAMFWKLDASGRVIVRAGGGGGRPFRQTTVRDAQGNPVTRLAAYLDSTEPSGLLDTESPGQPYGSSDYTNEYDADGRLLRSRFSDSVSRAGEGFDYSHDAEGRCETLTQIWSLGTSEERRDYDSRGRLWHVVRDGAPVPLPSPHETTVTYEYDSVDRILSATQVLDDETPRVVLRRAYENDGGILETSDPTSDIDFGGALLNLWSAGCGELRAQIPRVPSQECVVAGALPGDDFLL